MFEISLVVLVIVGLGGFALVLWRLLQSPAQSKLGLVMRKEIEETDARIRAVGYVGDIHFRPPDGKKLIVLPYYLWRTDRPNVFWDVAPQGYLDVPEDEKRIALEAQRIVEEVLAATQPGSIILLHVMAKGRPESGAALPGIIEGPRRKGFRFVTVSELLSVD